MLFRSLAHCDFFLFPKLKKPLKGRRFKTISEIKANATKELKAIIKEAYQDYFKKWKYLWDKCMRWGGEYFEGNFRNCTLKGTSKNLRFYDLIPRIY